MPAFAMDFSVTLVGESPRRVAARVPDFVRLERQYNIGASQLAEAPRIEWLAFLAWSAMQRCGDGVGDFESFLARLDDFSPEEAMPGEAETPPDS